ncbi:adhesive plaque matrix protein 2-like [Schistocerca piceifrons]|uniref:adhesive plaque matrix protein 2-like n=1 Tax=Schistocerca piceifrons TaxID=274613 RepID=UPI001F5F208D|nr:adhesive plaque matrix protein 2-like [Schistocerca piceifrons]
MLKGKTVLVYILLVFEFQFVFMCESNQTRQGCRIQEGTCLCGVGCYSEYRYSSREECRKALKGRGDDPCQVNPCENGGSCSQISFEPGYRCRCEGTGFYGNRCQNACPIPGTSTGRYSFPHECIVI